MCNKCAMRHEPPTGQKCTRDDQLPMDDALGLGLETDDVPLLALAAAAAAEINPHFVGFAKLTVVIGCKANIFAILIT